MLYGNWKELTRVDIQKSFNVILDYLSNLSEFKEGTEIVSENIRANFLSYVTTTPSNRFWEAHKKNIDLHYIFSGTEQIDLSPHNKLVSDEYHEDDDYYLLYGEKEASIVLNKGDFLLLLPGEAHRTGICTHENEKIQKIVFKIKN